MPDELTGPAHAKVNLFLRVLARESNGYHQLETLFCRLALADTVSVRKTDAPGEIDLTVTGAELGPIEDNLVYRAARAVLDATGRRIGVEIALAKRIPAAAGLGGGSSDAATTLELVNQLAGNPIPRSELLHMAARLGADIPFFASGASHALGWGHGERLVRVRGPAVHPALLLIPPVPVSTPTAYRWLDESRPTPIFRGALTLELESLASWTDLARMAGNDFESVVFAKEPKIRSAFEALTGTRPLLCRMSGSGSAIFAIYRSARDRDDAASMLGKKHGQVIPTETM